MGNDNLKDLFWYLSPELKEQINNKEDSNDLPVIKSFFDFKVLEDKYCYAFNRIKYKR